MSDLAVVVFKERNTADKVLNEVNAERAVELTDGCVAFRDAIGRTHLKLAVPADGRVEAAFGRSWTTLVGMLLACRLAGQPGGIGVDAYSREMFDELLGCGIRDDFIRALREAMGPNCSALFLRIGGADDEETLNAAQSRGGLLLRTLLSDAQVQRLRTVLVTVPKR